MTSEASNAVIGADDLQHVGDQVRLGGTYLVLMATAGVLSAVALLTNSVPILIGSMVVAPALPPLGLIAFGLAGGRIGEAARGLGVATAGLAVALAAATAATWALNATGVLPHEANLLDKPLLEERVRPGWYSVVAALAAGIAGTLALAERKGDTIIGVVAALALVPAVGAAGIAFLSNDPARALGGIMLLGINAGCLAAAGVATLLVLRPASRPRRDDG